MIKSNVKAIGFTALFFLGAFVFFCDAREADEQDASRVSERRDPFVPLVGVDSAKTRVGIGSRARISSFAESSKVLLSIFVSCQRNGRYGDPVPRIPLAATHRIMI